MFLGKTLLPQYHSNLMLGVTPRWACNVFGGGGGYPTHYMLYKLEIGVGLMGHLAQIQT